VADDEASRDRFEENVLTQEYVRLCTDIRGLETTAERIIGIAIAFFSIAATIGVDKKINIIFLVLPVAMLGVAAYSIMVYLWIFSMCGYKGHIENLINSKIRQRVLLWELLVAKRERPNLVGYVIVTSYTLVLISINVLCIARVQESYGGRASSALAVVVTTGLITLVLGWRQRNRFKEYTFSIARSLYLQSTTTDDQNSDSREVI
jgi:hypothetical protein